MNWSDWVRAQRIEPTTRRWLMAGGAAALLHVLALSMLPSNSKFEYYTVATPRVVEPIYLDITPDIRPARTPPMRSDADAARSSLYEPPIAVRTPRPSQAPPSVAPIVVDTAPPQVRPYAPGRVIPQSWRARCRLGDGEVSEADWRACRDSFLRTATPTGASARRRGDPNREFAAQGAARIAAYEARRAPAPTGSGNARTSSAPGSNFGMGDIDASVIYSVGERPVVNGGID